MAHIEPDSILRTLIITAGPLAQVAGEAYVRQLAAWNGPEAAIAVVAVNEAEAMDTAVSQALTRISPPNLATLLTAQGWALASATDLSLILLVDMTADGGEAANTLLTQTTSVIYRHLGIEASSLLIWLAGEAAEETGSELLTNCLTTPISTTRGIVVLGLCNEAGLRLPDEAALCQLSAHLLWCLTVTPLRHLPEHAAVQNSQLSSGAPLFSLGLVGWQWSPATTQTAFGRRWLEDVLAHWLSAASETVTPTEITTWLQIHALRPDDFAALLLKEEERQPPHFAMEAWRMPWPWEIEGIFTDVLFATSVDGENLKVYQDYASLRLGEPLQRATAALQKQAQTILDESPVGGISRACNWLQACLVENERLIEQLLDQEEALKENLVQMGSQQCRQQKQMKQWLTTWPSQCWPAWLRLSFRPWRWPAMAWRYYQWQTTGVELSHLLKQQAILQRHLSINRMSRQALFELGQIIRRVYGQVEEVGQMLHYLAGEIVGQQSVRSWEQADGSLEAASCLPLVHLAIPDILYDQVIGNIAEEAVIAAGICGGLGQQVTMLDEKIGELLQHLAVQRLDGVWQLTAVEVLLSRMEDAAQMQTYWQESWAMARPLWRVDETRLDEAARVQNGRMTAVCGAGVSLLTSLQPQPGAEVMYCESAERERLWMVQVRAGFG